MTLYHPEPLDPAFHRPDAILARRRSDWRWKSDTPVRDWFWWYGPALRRLAVTVVGCVLFAMVGYVLGTWLLSSAPIVGR